jgi:hypothetical protein
MNAMISSTVTPVAVACTTPVNRRLRRCASVARQIRMNARTCSVLFGTMCAKDGNARQKYSPKARALTAMGAANPIVAEHSPVQKPTAG